ncbi:helicase-associated domain-containing protein [Phytomonospora endophytica]|uniref:Helicase XPB/Ssl2 N-terminal domain-containing protein n=1 Tax=Phytomonospora endophytica TaxID=714109 RepID=A0A841G019_9ACTN|nr:helicase-associated domain-containing protein [Phytomonospora endophytica]MBB6038997.1 hypothetical protein [Phytomonospora endophytica]
MSAPALPGDQLAVRLRRMSDEALAGLLRDRPDLAVPEPADFTALAARATARASVARALDGLDRFALQILDGLRYVATDGTADLDALLTLVDDTENTLATVDRLRGLALVWGPDAQIRVSDAAADLLGRYVAGLGRPAEELDPDVAAVVADPATLRRTIMAAPPAARAVLDRLAADGPLGTVRTGSLRDDAADTPLRWLVRHRLLALVGDEGDDRTVELPREIGILLRRDTGPLGAIQSAPPQPDYPVVDSRAVDNAGAGAVMEAVRLTEALLTALADAPAPTLKGGGMGVRDLRRLAAGADIDNALAALLLETAYAAGLLGAEEEWLPSSAFDMWRTIPIASRWARIARAWLTMPREVALVGGKDDKGKPFNVLAPELSRTIVPKRRTEALGIVAGLPAGSAPTVDDVLALLSWHHPRARDLDRSRAVLREAAALGVTARDALTSYGRMLLAERNPDDDPLGVTAPEVDPVVERLDALLPPPVDEVVVQADLTVVVPGPPSTTLATELQMLAERESPTVYRVSPASIRRALDAGYTAEDLHALVRRRSRTEIPQALTYLIDDTSRLHGGLRVGTGGCYLRGEDAALLTEVFADRRLARFGLRRIAPTVLITRAPITELLDALREYGYAPVPEDAAGAAVLTRPTARRAAYAARPPHATDAVPRIDGVPLLALIERLRRVDAHVRSRPAAMTSVSDSSAALSVLQQALREKQPVWVGYLDGHGAQVTRRLLPVSLGAGYLRAEDQRTDTLHTVALHRITAASLEEPS